MLTTLATRLLLDKYRREGDRSEFILIETSDRRSAPLSELRGNAEAVGAWGLVARDQERIVGQVGDH